MSKPFTSQGPSPVDGGPPATGQCNRGGSCRIDAHLILPLPARGAGHHTPPTVHQDCKTAPYSSGYPWCARWPARIEAWVPGQDTDMPPRARTAVHHPCAVRHEAAQFNGIVPDHRVRRRRMPGAPFGAAEELVEVLDSEARNKPITTKKDLRTDRELLCILGHLVVHVLPGKEPPALLLGLGKEPDKGGVEAEPGISGRGLSVRSSR